MSLPDNVTADTVYTVQQAAASDILVSLGATGSVILKQDSDILAVNVDAVPGLIAALQAAASITAPGPVHVFDRDGDRWTLQPDGTYSADSYSFHGYTLDELRRDYGIQDPE